MTKKKFNRICPCYDDYGYTIYDLNHNYLGYGMDLNLQTWAKHIAEKKLKEPCEISASYTVNYVDTWTRHLLPHEITEPKKYCSGYPIVHSARKQLNFWVVQNHNDIAKLIKQLKKQNRNTDNLLIINSTLNEMHPHPSAAVPFQIRSFLSNLPRTKR